MGRQWQGDAPIVVHGTVTNHFFKGPLHEVNVFLLLEKDKRDTNQSLDASALGDCHLTHTEKCMAGLCTVDCPCSPISDRSDRFQETYTGEYYTAHKRNEAKL